MIETIIGCAIVVTGICLMFLILWREERRKRQNAEDDVVMARLRAELLHDQIPFPRGKQLPW